MAIYADKKDGRPTGRWRVEVQRGSARKRGRFDQHEDAVKAETQWLREFATGVLDNAKPRNEASDVPTFLGALVRKAAPILWDNSEHGKTSVVRIEKLIGWLGDPRLDTLQDFIDRSLTRLRTEGKAPATINRYYSALHKVIAWGGKRKYVPDMPDFEWQDEDEGRLRWLSQDEEVRMVAFLKTFGFDEAADFVVCAIDTGCRRSELLTAKRDQLHEKWLRLWETKSGAARSVPLTRRSHAILERRLPWAIEEHQLRYAWEKAKKAMGLSDDQDFVLHACRHTRATRFVEMGVNLGVIQRWLGHKNIATTMRYAHISDEAMLSALSQLENIHLTQAGGGDRVGQSSPHSASLIVRGLAPLQGSVLESVQ
jgi:integrase